MRNLILLSIVVGLGVIGLYVYTEIERAQFMRDLSQNMTALQSYISDERQDLQVTSQGWVEQEWHKGTQDNGMGAPLDEFQSTSQDSSDWDLQEWAPNYEAPLPKTDNNSLRSEVEELFSKYSELNKDRNEIVAELNAIQFEDISIINRIAFITNHELGAANDPKAEEKLSNERDALLSRGKELTPTIFELEEEFEQLIEDRDNLLRDYGFTSHSAFLQTHGEAYKVWDSTR